MVFLTVLQITPRIWKACHVYSSAIKDRIR